MCAMRFRHELSYDAPPDRVFAMLADPEFRRASCEAMEVISADALRVTPGHLSELQLLAEQGATEEVRRALFGLVAQIRGEKPGAIPTLRVVARG